MFLIKIFHLLPLSWVRALGRLMGVLIYRIDPRYRRLMIENLAGAGCDQEHIRLQAIRAIGANLAEGPWIWGSKPHNLIELIDCPQINELRQFAQAGQPVLFLTPHLGSFEAAARFYGSLGPLTALYREPHNPWMRTLMAKVRATAGLKTAPANFAGVKAMLKALRAGEAVGILPDQVPGNGEGVWTEFFGKPAYTMVLPQKLAAATQAKVIILICLPRPKGRWLIHFEQMTEAPSPENINRRFEKLILRFPVSYLWGYNRYKHPTGAPFPPDWPASPPKV